MRKQRRAEKQEKSKSKTVGGSKGAGHTQGPTRWQHIAAGVVVVVVAIVSYSNSFEGKLIFDDREAIIENTTVRSLSPIWGPLTPPVGPTTTGRPVVNLSVALNYALHGTEVYGYHLVNLAIHVVAALLLFGVVRRTLALPRLAEWLGEGSGRTATALALAVAAIWAAHPLHTSCVTYIIQRAESLMGLFYLLTLYLVIRGATAQRAWPWYSGAVVSCLLGIATKEVVATAPVVILVYDRVFLADSFKEILRRRWALYLGLAASWLLFLGLLASTDFKRGLRFKEWDCSRYLYTLTQIKMVSRYLRLALWPAPLVFDYGVFWVKGFSEVVAPAALIGLLLLGTLWALRFRPALGFLGVWFFAILSPTSSVIKLMNQTAVEYRMYLPLAAVVTLVVVGVHRLWRRLGPRVAVLGQRRWIVPAALAATVVVALCQVTRARNELYADPVALWEDNIAKWPGNPRAHNNLGMLLTDRGDQARALQEFKKAFDLKGDVFETATNLAIAYQRVGEVDRAIGYFSRAIELKPAEPVAHQHRGNAFSEAKRYDEAIRDYSRAIELKSDYVEAVYNRGNAHYHSKAYARAIADFTRAIALDPSHTDARSNRAVCYLYVGQHDRARADVKKLRELGGTPNPELIRRLAQPDGS